MLNHRFTDGPIKRARRLSGACSILTTVSPVARGDTAVTPRGQGLRRIEVGHMTCH
jgi:hypothetical protein